MGTSPTQGMLFPSLLQNVLVRWCGDHGSLGKGTPFIIINLKTDSESELGSNQGLPLTSCVTLALSGGYSNPTSKVVVRMK